MEEREITGIDRIRSLLVPVATLGMLVFNWLAVTGRLSGLETGAISDRYTTLLTPARYGFSVWWLIYLGVTVFSFYQVIPANIARFRPVRSLYVFSCALNCAWLYFWNAQQIAICFVILLALAIVLLVISYQFREPPSPTEMWITKAPFGFYAGWVVAAMLVNLAVLLKWSNVSMSPSAETALAVVLILFAAALAVLVRIRLRNYFFPLSVAWALTAIAVKQSGQTAVVVAAAIGVIVCLIASLSFVLSLNSTETEAEP